MLNRWHKRISESIRSRRLNRKKLALAVFLAIIATVMATIIFLNLHGGEKKIRYKIEHLFDTSDPQFLRTMGRLLGPSLIEGHRITALQNGDEIFPSMLEAIRGAQKTITFETYIYWSGKIGKEFSTALSERARAGVKVHVLLDWVGSGRMDKSYFDEMQQAGVEIEYYHPLRWYNLTRFNNRTHRKILVVDGKIGFTGGVGIADQWLGNAQSKDNWRDSHFKLEGPAVAQMQAAFIDNWIKTRFTVLYGSDYFPYLEKVGPSYAQVFKSSSGEGSESVRLMYLLSLASATTSIRLAAAYFVPDDLAIETFVAARKRGVSVEIIMPGPIMDIPIVRRASQDLWEQLLNAGVKIYEYQPTMYHCKVMIVDDLWVSVGSTNFDDRSFHLNEETNLNIYDPEFAQSQAKVFEHDKLQSRHITRIDFKRRPNWARLKENVAGIFRRQL